MFDLFNAKDRKFIVEENDVTAVVSVINSHRKEYVIELGNCGWADEPNKWFVAFYATDKQYGQIVDELNKLGTFKMNVSPNFKVVNMYFERGH